MVNGTKYRDFDVVNVLDVPGEQIYIAKRQHWFILAQKLIALFFLSLVFTSLVFLAIFFLHIAVSSILFYLSFIALTTSTVAIKLCMDWYCHLYIVTNRKLIEVYCSPLFSNRLNGVFLDQVRITEVDANREGIISEVLDIGTVTITFDRPTHQQEFVFENIPHSEEVCILLSEILIGQGELSSSHFWSKEKNSDTFSFTEEIFPAISQGGVR